MKQVTLGINAMGIRLGIEAAAKDAVIALKKIAKPIKEKDEIKQVATISAESAEIGAIIADTINKVGKDGVVTVEESQSFGIESEVVEGMQFDKGYVSPYMITNADRMEAEYKDAAILITDKRSLPFMIFFRFWKNWRRADAKNLSLSPMMLTVRLTTFVVNKLRGAFSVLAVKAPGYGDKKRKSFKILRF